MSPREKKAEHASIEDELRRCQDELAAFQEVTLDLVSRLDLDSLLTSIVRRAGQLVHTPHGFLDLVEAASDRLIPRIGVGMLADSLGFEVVRGEGLAGVVWQAGKPLLINDYDHWNGRITRYGVHMIRAVMGVPLLLRGRVIGVLGLAYGHDTDRVFDDRSESLLVPFARLATIAIENARSFEQIQSDARSKADLLEELRTALTEVKTLQGILPICSYCRKIRVEGGDPQEVRSWVTIEEYIGEHSKAQFSHGICPDCYEKLAGEKPK